MFTYGEPYIYAAYRDKLHNKMVECFGDNVSEVILITNRRLTRKGIAIAKCKSKKYKLNLKKYGIVVKKHNKR